MVPSTHIRSFSPVRLFDEQPVLPIGSPAVRSAVRNKTWSFAGTSRFAGFSGIVVSLLGLGCSAPQTPGSASRSPESQSIAQYDIARDLWLTRGKPREALTRVLDAIELDDENAEAEHLAALIFLDFCRQDHGECQLPNVVEHARRALYLNPDFLEARNTLGVSLIHQKQLREAIEVLQPLADNILYKTPENAWGNLGWAYLELKEPKKAIAALTRSVTAQPQFCVGFFRLGLAHESLKDYEPAQLAYTQALETAEGRCQGLQAAYLGRARVSIALHQPIVAVDDLKTCMQLAQNTDAGRECDLLQSEMAP